MLSAKVIQSLKRNNVSGNGELTMERTKDVLKGANRKQKNEIDALAGVKRVSINRVYTTGSISAKVAIAIAQVLNVDPLYLTGEADERGECSDKTLNSFLITKGYTDVSVETRKKPGPKPKDKAAPKKDTASKPAASVEPPVQEAKPAPVKKAPVADQSSKMTEEEAVGLLKSKFIQAKYSDDAKAKLDEIKALLV